MNITLRNFVPQGSRGFGWVRVWGWGGGGEQGWGKGEGRGWRVGGGVVGGALKTKVVGVRRNDTCLQFIFKYIFITYIFVKPTL